MNGTITDRAAYSPLLDLHQQANMILHTYKEQSGNEEQFMAQFKEDQLSLLGNYQYPGDQMYNALLRMGHELEMCLNEHGLSIYALPLYKRYLQCLYAMATFRSHENADLGKIALGAFRKLLQSIPLVQNDLVTLYQQNQLTEPLGDDVLKRFPAYVDEWLRAPPLDRVRLEFVYFDNEHFHSRYRATRVQYQLQNLLQGFSTQNTSIQNYNQQDILLTEQMMELYCACELSTLSTAPYREFMREFFRFSVLETFGREKPVSLQSHIANLASVEQGMFFLQRQMFKEKIASQAMLAYILRRTGRPELCQYISYGLYTYWLENKEDNFQIIKFLIFMALSQGGKVQEQNLVNQLLDIFNGEEIVNGYGYEQLRELISMYAINGFQHNENILRFVSEHLYFTEAVFDLGLQDPDLFAQLHQLQQLILKQIYQTLNSPNTRIAQQNEEMRIQEQLNTLMQRGRQMAGASLLEFLSLNYGYKKQFVLSFKQQSCLLGDILDENIASQLVEAGFQLVKDNIFNYEDREAQLVGVELCLQQEKAIVYGNGQINDLYRQHYLNSIMLKQHQVQQELNEGQDCLADQLWIDDSQAGLLKQQQLLEDVFTEIETDNCIWPEGSKLSFQTSSRQLEDLEYPATTPAILISFLDECAKKITHTDPNNRNEWGCIEKDKGDDSLLYRTIYNVLTFFD